MKSLIYITFRATIPDSLDGQPFQKIGCFACPLDFHDPDNSLNRILEKQNDCLLLVKIESCKTLETGAIEEPERSEILKAIQEKGYWLKSWVPDLN